MYFLFVIKLVRMPKTKWTSSPTLNIFNLKCSPYKNIAYLRFFFGSLIQSQSISVDEWMVLYIYFEFVVYRDSVKAGISFETWVCPQWYGDKEKMRLEPKWKLETNWKLGYTYILNAQVYSIHSYMWNKNLRIQSLTVFNEMKTLTCHSAIVFFR